MSRLVQINYDTYTRAGDVGVIAICLVIVILLLTSYVSHTRSFYVFLSIIGLLIAAAFVNIGYHDLLRYFSPNRRTLIYTLRILYHALLFDVFFLFILYTTIVSGLEKRSARFVTTVSMILLFVVIGFDIGRAVLGRGFQIADDGTVTNRTNIFMIGYLLFVALLVLLLRRVRNLLYKRVMYGFYGTMVLSLLLRFGQLPLHTSSLTTMTFVFPVIAMLYIMHSNPYNVTLGAVDARSMEDMIRDLYSRKRAFVFMSLNLPEYDEEGRELPEDVRAEIRRTYGEFFRDSVLFQVGNGHIILIAPKRRNPDYETKIGKMLDAFHAHYAQFQHSYRIVVGESIDEISRKNEYISLIQSVHARMKINTIYRVGQEDIERFNRYEYILRELGDIYEKADLDDPRVRAYCQPVFNIETGRFDTAEALMRLVLDETGMVYPDLFIPLAESHGYIHVLTEIILHKTCKEIRRLMEDGFQLRRISVNVSVLELKSESFCGDVNRIIEGNSIPGEKVAIELTESRNEADFIIMKEKIEELHAQGIKFYLDDFGTGYSNMERIMELPFDIIKFDRSLVIASGTDERSERIVDNLAHMFKDMEYSVLYEGVEDEVDEERCREMSASYLQGYKYSRPIPIEQLRVFLPKAG